MEEKWDQLRKYIEELKEENEDNIFESVYKEILDKMKELTK